MVQKKLPLINSAHGSETRNIINELIKLFNGMGYTYDEALQNAHNILKEAQKTNDMNKDVQKQVDELILHAGESDAEVIQARGGLPLLKDRLDETDSQLAHTTNRLDDFNLEQDFSFVKDTFEGNADTAKYYAQFMDGFRIENIGGNELFFEIDDVQIRVESGQGYTGMFPLFKKVKVYADSDFRAEVRGKLDAPYNITLFDSFDRPDSETELGVSDSGHYYLVNDDFGNNEYPIGIIDGQAYSKTAVSMLTYALLTASADKYSLEADLIMHTIDANAGGLVFNFENHDNYLLVRGHDDGVMRFLQKRNGKFSTIIDSELSVYDEAGQTIHCNVERDSNNFKIYVDGQLVIDFDFTEEDSNQIKGTLHGFGLKGSMRADNLKIIY